MATAAPTRVVIADDDVLLREGVASLLQRSSFDVVGQAGDARELLRLVAEQEPDLVIIDIRMPPTLTTEGLDAARRIREEHRAVAASKKDALSSTIRQRSTLPGSQRRGRTALQLPGIVGLEVGTRLLRVADSTQRVRGSADASPRAARDHRVQMEEAVMLICYDGSEGAARAIETAARLFGSRRAVVLNVAAAITFAESVVATTSPVAPGSAFEQLNADDARRVANTGAELARAAGLEATARSELAASGWEGIVDVADELGAAVIVIGSRGLTGVREAFEGSVSHQVAAHAGRPVLIVPPPHGEQ